MQDVLKRSWPKDLSQTLVYRGGEKPLHEYLNQNAKERPNDTAYIFYGNEITWNQLNDDTNRLVHFLKKKGIKKGDCIALFMQNCPQYLIGHYAIQKLGAIVVPLNPMYKEAELEYLVNEVSIKAIISGQELYERIRNVSGKIPSVEFVLTTNYADYLPNENDITMPLPDELKLKKRNIKNTFDFIEIIKQHNPLDETAEIDLWEDVGLMVFTSGTTGRPKAAMLTYGNALFKTATIVQTKNYNEETRTTAISPLCHIAGMLMGVNIPVYSGCQTVLFTRFDAEAAITAIEKYKINSWYTVATMNVAILNHPGVEKRDLSSLKTNFATSFGIPVNKQLADDWSKLTGGCILCESSYGLSETHTADTFMPIDKIKFGTCGIPTYDTEIRIVDIETGKDLPPGKQGEIAVKNKGVFKGYFNRPDATLETLRDGWVFTGDIGMIDEDGYLYFNGRIKEMIKSSGYSVFPEDVEALMKEHEAILQVAAVGVPDTVRGESVKAFIVLKPKYKGKITESAIIEWAKQKMAAYKYPRKVEFRDSLPATSSGKVLRRLLKEE
ncbi:AMP-dependent synthetase [Pueribacillus theae]|uniref:AMP-dependent synthetase n=1 Tax=Pueribacillus theae TaxID=2171751 RepID=A0A2U1JW71_9BACI|nr:AMP-binding protein [Pueribacillus theae]PWA09457.1 AMP-dependent synthetase [Pueribacillus theae]